MPGETILIVDDDLDIRELLSDRLDAMGYTPVEAADGVLGLEAIRREAPDVVFLDIQMPRLDGFGVLRQLQEERLDPVVVVITAHGSVERVVEAMRLGAYDYVEKPFDTGRIEVVLDKALAANALSREHAAMQEAIRERTPAFIGEAPAGQVGGAFARRAAASDGSVRTLGVRGTGNEGLA